MTANQEDALYEFLENVTEPFTLENVVSFVRMIVPQKANRLAMEITTLINSKNIAFQMEDKRWISRRGCFESARFAVAPSRLELQNGIFIPGHRCVPFANPALLPHEYVFTWQGSRVPFTTTEGSPEEFYPYYMIFGEEYAPQYVARDNPENESAFNSDPYEDPPEVSIHTLDMRNIYRETAFVPGDRFIVRTTDWKEGVFELEKVEKDVWQEAELLAWFECAETGFDRSFEHLGPGGSTDEQIAYAYWYGGKRMRDVPAYSLEEYLYEKTDKIETVPYGIETRFWFAGKEIPDRKTLEGALSTADRTFIEDMLFDLGIPISEYVLQSYVRDALYRNDTDITRLMERIIPRSVGIDGRRRSYIAEYAADVMVEFAHTYSMFADQAMGHIRQRVGELHTAVIDLSTRLRKGDIDPSWLPKHTFVVLSQIQSHAAGVMEDLDAEDAPAEMELEAMDSSLDSMIETYEDLKELIDDSMDSFRKSNITVLRGSPIAEADSWLTLQLSIGGTDIWRRIVLPGTCTMADIQRIICVLFGWKEKSTRFSITRSLRGNEGSRNRDRTINSQVSLADLGSQGVIEFLCEYGSSWTVKIIYLSPPDMPEENRICCVAGAGAAPPDVIEGPLRYKKYLNSRTNVVTDKAEEDSDPDLFNLGECDRLLASLFARENQAT
jgi:hypothetical protein